MQTCMLYMRMYYIAVFAVFVFFAYSFPLLTQARFKPVTHWYASKHSTLECLKFSEKITNRDSGSSDTNRGAEYVERARERDTGRNTGTIL